MIRHATDWAIRLMPGIQTALLKHHDESVAELFPLKKPQKAKKVKKQKTV